MNEITFVIIDDHPLFRQGVVDTLCLETGLISLGEAADGAVALDLIREKQPVVAIIDVNLPNMNGQQITRQIVAEKLRTHIILLTAYDDEEQKIHAMRAGAAAYCTKDAHRDYSPGSCRENVFGRAVRRRNNRSTLACV
jgi:two-component system nitrate/nitrite response regulator NarL